MRRSRKPVGPRGSREFESPPLRSIYAVTTGFRTKRCTKIGTPPRSTPCSNPTPVVAVQRVHYPKIGDAVVGRSRLGDGRWRASGPERYTFSKCRLYTRGVSVVAEPDRGFATLPSR